MRRRLHRALLLATTALLVPLAAAAQAPDARPQGGQVVAGSASISQAPGRTQVTQTSNRAVIEWQRLDVGRDHRLDIRQPGASSWSLQRVTGPDPSAIAGRVTSNGGVAIVNPNGVTFAEGAQVDVAALIATASDTANQAFMAGRMAFDGAPRPGARIENRGTVTVAEQGLAALVGPSVANSGTIRARLGRVALAGAEGFALDLAGDGLLSLDVTHQVAAAPAGGAALVTNTGTIEAERGHVLLTARAASSVLETLVEAGGRISAPGGVVEATAPGGAVRVPAGARLDASAPGGGGQVTVGAGRASRPGAATDLAARTTIERGAELRADAAGAGDGGRVIVHSRDRTEMRGSASARGAGLVGARTGRGGLVEVSSKGSVAIDAKLDAGPGGRVLLDPEELRVVQALSGGTEPAEVTASTIGAATGDVTLSATRAVHVEAAIAKPQGELRIETTGTSPADSIHIGAAVTLGGGLTLSSAGDITQSAPIAAARLQAESTMGAVRLDSTRNAIAALGGGSAAGLFELSNGGDLAVTGPVAARDVRLWARQTLSIEARIAAEARLELSGLRGITQAEGGAGLSATELLLEAVSGALLLDGAGNRILNLHDTAAPRGLALANEADLNVTGTIVGGSVALTARRGSITQDPSASRLIVADLFLEAPQGGVLFDGQLNTIPRLAAQVRDALVLDAGGPLTLSGPVEAASLRLRAFGDLSQETGAVVRTGRLSAEAVGGAVLLADPLNEIAALGDVSAGTEIRIGNAVPLDIAGLVAAPEVALVAAGTIGQAGGGRIETGLLRATALLGDVALDGPGNAVAALGGSGAAGGFALATTGTLAVTGAVDAGGAVAIAAEALTLAADIAGLRVALRAPGGDLLQQAGAVVTEALDAQALGIVRLDAPANRIGAIAGGAGLVFGVRSARAATAAGIAAPEVALDVAGDLTQAAGDAGIATALLHARATGRVALAATANAIESLGEVAAPLGLSVTTGTALLLTSPVDVPQAVLRAGGALAQLPGGSLAAGTLEVASGGDVTLDLGANAVARLLSAEAAGAFRLATGGALSLEGRIASAGAMVLRATDGIAQPAGVVVAPSLEARALQGAVRLDRPNQVAVLAGGGAADLFRFAHAGGAPLRLGGLISAPEVALALPAGIVEGGGALRAQALALDADGAVVLDQAGHRVGAVSGRAGALRLAAGGPLDVTRPLAVAGDLGLDAEGIGFLAPASAGGAVLLVSPHGHVVQAPTGAALAFAGGLTVHGNGIVALDGAGNAIPVLAGGSAVGSFALATTGALRVAAAAPGGGVPLGGIGPAVEAATVTLGAGGALVLDGAGLAAGTALALSAGGAMSLDGTRIDAPSATLRAEGAMALDRATLAAQVVDARSAAGMTLDGASLTAAAVTLRAEGAMALDRATLAAQAVDARTAAGMTLDGASLAAGAVTLRAEGAMALGTAAIAAASLDAQAGTVLGLGQARLDAATVSLRSAGSLAMDGAAIAATGIEARAAGAIGLARAGLAAETMDLVAGTTLALDGATLTAGRAVLLAAPQGLEGGARSTLRPLDPARRPVLVVDTRREGALAALPADLAADLPGVEAAAQPIQLGYFGPARATSAGGAVIDLAAGDSPVFLLLDGAPALGVLDAGRLGVLGQGGSAFLVGTLAGQGGAAAAALARVTPGQSGYSFNACPIGVANCGAGPTPSAPEAEALAIRQRPAGFDPLPAAWGGAGGLVLVVEEGVEGE